MFSYRPQTLVHRLFRFDIKRPIFHPSEHDTSEGYSLETVLSDALSAFVAQLQTGTDVLPPDAVRAFQLADDVQKHLKHLMRLDNIAHESKQAEAWFTATHQQAAMAWDTAGSEAVIVSR